MTEGPDERPTTDKPLHGPPRPRVSPILAVVGLLIAIAVIFAIITWVRYNT